MASILVDDAADIVRHGADRATIRCDAIPQTVETPRGMRANILLANEFDPGPVPEVVRPARDALVEVRH